MVSFFTCCWERDWQQILLDPLYLSQRQIANHLFPFAEKVLIINNVKDLDAVRLAAQKKIDEGVLTRYVVAQEVADRVMTSFELKREDFRPDPPVHPDWIYYNALGPLTAIFSCQSDYLLYLTGDVRLDEPVEWIEKALHLMEKDSRYKVANLTWNNNYAEAKKESKRVRKGFYVAEQGFSDQLFLVKRVDFQAPIYGVIREDSNHYPRGDVFEKRVFSAMKNRGWLRLTYSKGSYTHENFLMGTFSKESLELLRSRIDLVEVLSPYLKMQRSGVSYKALCPFHEEKTPSFIIQKGDTHYHCFGCGAHGDAIQFMMTYLRMSFADAVESLAERFGVLLEEVEGASNAPKGPTKALLKDALDRAAQFYHFTLLHTQEGHVALEYLYSRGIDLSFIRQFQMGLAPKDENLFFGVMHEQKISDPVLRDAGLLSASGRVFFSDRITIPILDAMGSVIGFSSRKFKPETFGGKYINTSETPLFKKSKILFGLSYCRKRIAKERQVLIVEGQIDAMRLIVNGFDYVVAGQGTAFGEEMAKELIHLGVHKVYLCLDGDTAGQEATVKIGHLFQKEGIEVWVLSLPEKCDPDLILQEKGPQDFQRRIDESIEYLPFLVAHFSKTINMQTPAGKNELVQTIANRIREWNHPLMVHESLRKLARLTQTPETMVGAEGPTPIAVQQTAKVGFTEVDPDRILEADLLRWLVISNIPDKIVPIAELNIKPEHFRLSAARMLYEKVLQALKENTSCDLLSLAIDLENPEQQLFLSEILQKRINKEKALNGFIETVQRLLERFWMQQREEIKLKIYSGTCSEAEVLELAKQFDAIKRERPQVKMP